VPGIGQEMIQRPAGIMCVESDGLSEAEGDHASMVGRSCEG
jgi:hypothetical protein